MIWFWLIAGLLTLAALIALLRPLVRGAGAAADHSESVVAIYRRQLANIDNEVAQERLPAEQAADARAEVTRRMLAASDQETRDSSAANATPAETSRRIGAAVGIAALLPASALAIYFAVGAPATIDQARTVDDAAKSPHDRAELSAAADQLKARLQREPGQWEGWVLLGRALASLGRFAEAKEAYTQVIVLRPGEPGLHAEFGELLVLAAGGTVTPEAEAEFAKSASDPRARFYSAEAQLQRGDSTAAKAGFRALLADAPADAPWRKVVAERLAEIAPGEPEIGAMRPAPPAAPSAGPTAQDVAAAQAMSPEERQAMIRGMVDRLAARLEQNPGDTEGWVRLARAYDVLGDREKAEAARGRAAALGTAPAAPPATTAVPFGK
jgi:cytochrome c-type biogenesis protein CcmH